MEETIPFSALLSLFAPVASIEGAGAMLAPLNPRPGETGCAFSAPNMSGTLTAVFV